MAEADNYTFVDADGAKRTARAQSFGNQVFNGGVVVGARYTVLGFGSATQTGATAKSIGATGITVPAGATHALVSIDGAAARMRDDNTDPTTTAGLYVPDGSVMELCMADFTDVAFIAVTGTISINISWRKYDS